MIWFFITFSVIVSVATFIWCGCIVEYMKTERKCIDKNSERLTLLEKQSNQAYIELYKTTEFHTHKLTELELEQKNNQSGN